MNPPVVFIGSFGGSGGGGGGSGFDGIVQVFSDLPVDATAAIDEVWLVRESEGLWFFNHKQRGLYQRVAETGVREADWQYLGEWQEEFSDANFQIYNGTNNTKVMKLDLSVIAAGTTRTLTVPNQNGTIALTSDIAALSGVYQPLDSDLTAIAALVNTGFSARTASDTWALRSLAAPSAGFTIANPAGVSGNPTFALADDLAALEALATTGYARRTGADAWTLDTSIPAASLTPPGSTTQVIYNNAGAFGAISTLTESGGVLTKTRNALAVTTNDAFVIANTTASTGVVPAQYSPALRWSGQAFDGDTSTDTQISFRAYVATFNGGSYNDALWTIESRVGSGGAWSFPMTYSTAGRLTLDSLTATGQVQASAIAGSQGSIDLSDVVSGVAVYSGLGFVVNGGAGFDFNPNDGDGSGFLNINGGLTLTTPLDETYGGTGLTSYAQGDLLYASAANTLAKLAKNTSATRYLSNTGTNNNPAWAQIVLSNGISGFGTNVATALAVNVGSAGAPVVNGGVLGTPSSGTVTNLTGTASININGTVGATTPSTIQSTGITQTAGSTLSISSGTNQRAGNLTLVAGTVTVSNTTVTANTIVQLTRKTSGGTIGTAITYTVSTGNSFTVNSDNILDTSTFSYFLIEVP